MEFTLFSIYEVGFFFTQTLLLLFFRYWTMDRSLQRRLQKTNYQHIKRLCRDRGQLFEDPDFTPTNRSIYRNKKPALHPIVWLRPHVSDSKFICIRVKIHHSVLIKF